MYAIRQPIINQPISYRTLSTFSDLEQQEDVGLQESWKLWTRRHYKFLAIIIVLITTVSAASLVYYLLYPVEDYIRCSLDKKGIDYIHLGRLYNHVDCLDDQICLETESRAQCFHTFL